MAFEYEILRYRPALREDVLALRLREAGGVNPAAVESQWRWKYEQNPYLTEPLVLLARDSIDGVVGMLGLYGSRWQFGAGHGPRSVPCGRLRRSGASA
jgi:hypothetical protein